jgi:hypothetical protein
MSKFKVGDLVELDFSKKIDRPFYSQTSVFEYLCNSSRPWRVHRISYNNKEEFLHLAHYSLGFLSKRFKIFKKQTPKERNRALLQKNNSK